MVLSLVLPALIAGAGQADAKHRGFLETNNQVSDEASTATETKNHNQDNYNDATNNAKDHMNNKKAERKDRHDKKMKNKSHRLENEKHDIDEDYQEALYKIKKSQLPDNMKELLRTQAEENRNLALEQAKSRDELMKKHKAAREEHRDEFMKDKSNRKAVKGVMDIL